MRKKTLGCALAVSVALASVPSLRADDAGADGAPKPVSPEEIEALRRRIESERRSQAELLFDDHTESGDLNNRLDFRRYGFKVALRGDATTLLASVTRAPYETIHDLLTATGTGVTIGAERRLRSSIASHVELGLMHFDEGATSVGGEATVTVHPSEKLRYSAGLARTRVEESFLTAVGIRPVAGPFAGERVGPVMENRLEGSGSYRLPKRFDVYGEAALGVRTGSNVESNGFRRLGAGAGYNALVAAEDRALSLLRFSVSLYYFGYDKDLFGYGGASLLDAAYQPVPVSALGSDGLPTVAEPGTAGVGGYFSPSHFLSRLARVDVRGRPRPRLDYAVAVFLGRQSYTGTEPRLAAGAYAEVVLRSGDRVSLPVSWSWDNVGPYRQQTLQARLRARF